MLKGDQGQTNTFLDRDPESHQEYDSFFGRYFKNEMRINLTLLIFVPLFLFVFSFQSCKATDNSDKKSMATSTPTSAKKLVPSINATPLKKITTPYLKNVPIISVYLNENISKKERKRILEKMKKIGKVLGCGNPYSFTVYVEGMSAKEAAKKYSLINDPAIRVVSPHEQPVTFSYGME